MNRKQLIWAGVLVAAAAGAGLAFRQTGGAWGTTAVAAATTPAGSAGVVVGAGRTEPASEEIDVSTELDGRLKRVAVEEGQRVRRGQVIAELENADFVARVALANAEVAERQAAL